MSASCFSHKLKELGQEAQGCFEVFLTNTYVPRLTCRLVPAAGVVPVAAELLWVSSGVGEALS